MMGCFNGGVESVLQLTYAFGMYGEHAIEPISITACSETMMVGTYIESGYVAS